MTKHSVNSFMVDGRWYRCIDKRSSPLFDVSVVTKLSLSTESNYYVVHGSFCRIIR